jgi:DNA-binding IclR family transcriptional regulator
MRELTARTGNTSYLCVRADQVAMCVESVESPEGLISRLGVGRTLPLHAGAAAKILLAHLPEAGQREVLASKLVRFTPFTVTDRKQLRRELGRIRTHGYAYTSQEVDPGSHAVAAPVSDFSGQVVAALGIAGPLHKFREPRLRELIDLVKHFGRLISEKLGAPVEKDA